MKKIFTNTKINGAILAILAALSMSLSMTLAKHLSNDIPTSLVVFVRSCFGMLFFIPLILRNMDQGFKTTKLWLHILRACFTVGAMLCTYYTYRYLPVAFATSLGMTSALFTTILSWAILKDHVGITKWIIIFIGYCGVILVIRPTSFLLDFAIVTALLANILASCSIISAKILSRTDSTITIMLYSNICIVIFSGILNTGGWQILRIQDLMLLAGTGLLGIATQFCSMTALRFCQPSFLAPFEYTRMFFGVLIGLFIFQEIPSLYSIIGSIIIISSTYFLTKIEKK
jgi:drug/metabolite transporter (DMT)-like permease